MAGFVIPRDLGLRLEGIHDPLDDPAPLRHAAVLALLLETGDEPRLLLTERSSELPSHAGQLAFPGGKPEPTDGSLVETALREAEEEVGLVREGLTVVGRLDPVPTPTGFMIIPFVARAPDGWIPSRQSAEVKVLLQPTIVELVQTHRFKGKVKWEGRSYTMHEFPIHQPPLWGATARMVWDLLVRMQAI